MKRYFATIVLISAQLAIISGAEASSSIQVIKPSTSKIAVIGAPKKVIKPTKQPAAKLEKIGDSDKSVPPLAEVRPATEKSRMAAPMPIKPIVAAPAVQSMEVKSEQPKAPALPASNSGEEAVPVVRTVTTDVVQQ